MQKTYARSYVLAAGGGVAAAILLAFQLSSCSSSSTSTPNEFPDASEESDSTVTPDSQAEGQAPDVRVTVDASGDVSATDATDAGDASDAGPFCSVSVPEAGGFLSAYAAAVCQSLATCCNVGSSFNTASCLSVYDVPGSGSYLGVMYPLRFLDGGRVAYDPASACNCLEAIATINCGTVTAEALDSLEQTCFGAVHGTVPAENLTDAGDAGDGGAPGCASSYECVPGAYCSVELTSDPVDGGLGTCRQLVPDGGTCTDNFQCSYLANGNPSLYCSTDSGICAPRLEAGAPCAVNPTCSSNICDESICASGLVFASSEICAYLTVVDAGDAGGGD